MIELNKIYLGDCYELIKQIEDKSIDCIYTDIPYLYKKGGGGKSEISRRITKSRSDLEEFNLSDGIDFEILGEFLRVLKKVNLFIWCSKMQILDILNYFKEYNFEILVWCKTNPVPKTHNVWLSDVEYCLYFREGGVSLNDGYSIKSKFFISPINQRDKEKFKHPTIKPVELVEKHLLHATKENDIVLDAFIGSGTTAIACKNTNRQFIGFEINNDFYTIANNRLNNIDARGVQSLFTI